MDWVQSLLVAVDQRQRRSRLVGPIYGVVKKSGDDRANQFVVALGWYGFVAIYPLLLVVVTVFGFIGAASLGHSLVSTLHQFPVVGSQFNPERGSSSLHGSVFGLVIGLIGLVYGAQGVTQTVQQAMAQVWNVPEARAPRICPKTPSQSSWLGHDRRGLRRQCRGGNLGDGYGRELDDSHSGLRRSDPGQRLALLRRVPGLDPREQSLPKTCFLGQRWPRSDSRCSSRWARVWSSTRSATVPPRMVSSAS